MRMLNMRELDVLNILWGREEPLMAMDIVNESNGLTQSTVTAVLRKLLKDNMVEVVGITHSGRVLSRTYRPTEESRDVILQSFVETYNRFNNVISEAEFCAEILAGDQTKTEAAKLFKTLKQLGV